MVKLFKLKIEPTVQMELIVNNGVNDPEFCHKSYSLMKDVNIHNLRIFGQFSFAYLFILFERFVIGNIH